MECMGRKCSEETKRKLSEIHKGKSYHNKGFQKGHKSFLKPETYKKIGEHFKSIGHRPHTNGNWKGGKIDYLKKKAKERDKYTCQLCSFSDAGIMQVDHIKPKTLFPELFEVLENLMTLCPNCHARKTIKEKSERLWKTGRPKKEVLSDSSDSG